MQVSFTPSPFGRPGGPVGRPSFNNIGAHIDLGPQKPQNILPQEQSFFNPSSTQSNKIFIGSESEVTTTTSSPTTTEEIKTETPAPTTPKRSFPSFPIRGDSLSFKPKLDFSRKTKSTFKFGRQQQAQENVNSEEQDEIVTEQSDVASTEQSSTSKPETSSKKRFFVDLTGGRRLPRVKSNQLFNKRKRPDKERFRLKLAQLKATASTASQPEAVTEAVTEARETTPKTVEVTPLVNKFKNKLRKNPLTFFSKVPDVSFTNTLLKFRSRNKSFGAEKKKAVKDTAPEADDDLESDSITTTEAAVANVLSVESELAEDVVEVQEKKTKPIPPRKDSKAPLHSNIRVEFKKKVEEDDESSRRGKFFIKPDGRKPRVKSNIRAKFAHRGQHFGGQQAHTAPASSEEETFDGASSHLDLTPFNKETDPEVEDINTEKREVNNNDAPSPSPAITNEIVDVVETKTISPQAASHDLPLFPLQPVILNPRQSHREPASSPERPPLPPAILKHISHITDIRSLPPLPPLFRNKKFSKKVKKVVTTPAPVTEEEITEEHVVTTTSSVSDSLLQQLVIGDDSAQSPSVSHSSSINSDPDPQVSTPSQTPVSGSNKLSAFRALQQQVKKRDLEYSSQLTKDLV